MKNSLQYYLDSQATPFPWLVPLMAIQIAVFLVLMGIWAVWLVRRGRVLAEKEDFKAEEKPEEPDSLTSNADKQLLQLGQTYIKAKLDHDKEGVENSKHELESLLRSEFERLKTKFKQDSVLSRRLMIKKIRCVLVKHPYDNLGRRMAIEAKQVFLRQVLGETKWWHKFEEYL